MLELMTTLGIFKGVFALEVSITDRPDDDNLCLIACVELRPKGYVLQQLLELKPTDNKFKKLSPNYHPFTRSGSVNKRQADYAKALQEIQDALNSWDNTPTKEI